MFRIRHSHSLAPLLVALATAGCGLCQDSDIDTKVSPNQKLAVTVFHRNCGVTTEDVTWITLHSRAEKYDRAESAILISKGSHKVEVSWDGDKRLAVRCFDCRADDISTQIVKFAGVTIAYEP